MSLSLGLLLTSCNKEDSSDISEYADLVFYGNIFTAEDANDGIAKAFAVKNGKFIYVGSEDKVAKYGQVRFLGMEIS